MNIFIKIIFLLSFASNIGRSDDVEFYLYNEPDPNSVSQIFTGNEQSITKYKKELPLRIYIHGWNGSYVKYPTNIIKEAYVKKSGLNLIVVNWKKALNNDYPKVTRELRNVAKATSNMILFLNSKANVKFSNVYVIGHSLGAHIAGLTGRNLLPNKVDTIYALDPARFLFTLSDYIRSGDAEYVEVMHTNVDSFGFGIRRKSGDADFYPNYGLMQLDCKQEKVPIKCNHIAAVKYLAKSLSADHDFQGFECPIFDILNSRKCQCKNECDKHIMGGEPSSKNNNNGSFYVQIDTIE